MAIHDWTRVYAGLFHDFHQSWTVRIKNALNSRLLPDGLYALIAERPRIVETSPKESYAGLANRIIVKENFARTVAAIEIVSPGNKDS